MSAMDEAIQRAKQRSGPPEAPKPTPQQERQLTATLDRSMAESRAAKECDRFTVTKPNAEPILVHFNPVQTIEEVRSVWYPGCGVLPA